MKILTVVGARPQFVKAAVVSQDILAQAGAVECLVHTGQHYDPRMSQVFFDQLGIPRPAYNLQIGSGPHGQQTGMMLTRLEEVMLREKPQVVVVYGDTNSTLAGALAAAKLHIPVAHVEAGLRSFNRHMPEEVNRVLTDHVSRLLLCPTQQAVTNLAAEGVREGVVLVGDVMYDAALRFGPLADAIEPPPDARDLPRRGYALLTCHRAENTDERDRLAAILQAASTLAARLPVVFPVHPRTRKQIAALGLPAAAGLRIVEPLSYLEMVRLERAAAVILTDSGGVQKEAFFYGVPCVTLREETEWVETLEGGANLLAGWQAERIATAAAAQLARTDPLPDPAPLYGHGQASPRTARAIAELAGA